jgi:hypothetical protein
MFTVNTCCKYTVSGRPGRPVGRPEKVSDTFFSRDLPFFSLDSTYDHRNIPQYSAIQIFIFGQRYVPILKTFLFVF